MTTDEREDQVVQALELGRIFPLWGIVENASGALQCECESGPNCKRRPGKHPRFRRKITDVATDDPARVRGWLKKHPDTNFGVYTGERSVVVDADVRPDGPNGLLSLEYLEIDNSQRLPESVVVISGRGNGSRHLYFNPPPNFKITSLNGFLPGVDLKAQRQYVVAPGSRHLAGGYYHFADECGPVEQLISDVPEFLLSEILAATTHGMAAPGSKTVYSASPDPSPPNDLPRPGPLRSNKVVLSAILRDRVAGPLYRGVLRFQDRSRNDMALADKLTFYSSHNFDQALELLLGSKLYREKFLRPMNRNWNYASWTLRKAFFSNPNNWIPEPRKSRSTGARRGRKPSGMTLAILSVRHQHPDWKPSRIAAELDLNIDAVRSALHRLKNGAYPDPMCFTMQVANTQINRESRNTVERVHSTLFQSVPDSLPIRLVSAEEAILVFHEKRIMSVVGSSERRQTLDTCTGELVSKEAA